MNAQLVYVTTPSKIISKKIANKLLEAKLIACANIIDGMESIYLWEGKPNANSETVLILKTTEDKVPAITEMVKSLHDHKCPCIASVPITGGNEDFLKWIHEQTS